MKENKCILCGKPIPPKDYYLRKSKRTISRVYQTTKYCSEECRLKVNLAHALGSRRKRGVVHIEISRTSRERLYEIKDSLNKEGFKKGNNTTDNVIFYLLDVLKKSFFLQKENKELKNKLGI